jgi:hypothetical protein
MRITAFSIILFFVCLNLSLYVINVTQLVGNVGMSPYESPANILSMFSTLIFIGVGTIVGWATGNLIFGGAIALIIGVCSYLFNVVNWVFNGTSLFLSKIMGSSPQTDAIIMSLQVLMAVVWFWFILGFISQRQLET